MENRVLVIGASGQDGVILSRLLTLSGVSVVGTCRSREKVEKLKNYLPGVEIRELDVRSRDSVSALIQELEPAQIYNLSAISSVQESWTRPHEVFDTNVNGVLNILEAVRTLGTSSRVFQASSSEMYGAGTLPVNESSPFAPKSPYGISKLSAHNLVRVYREAYGLFACSGILFNHESPLRESAYLSRRISQQVAEIFLGLRKSLRVGNLETVRDWGWAPDYVEAMRLILNARGAGDYVIATGITHAVGDMVQAAFESIDVSDWEKHVEVDSSFMRINDPKVTAGDPSLIYEKLGWRASKAFTEMVSEMVRHDIATLRDQSSDSGKRWVSKILI